MNRLSYIAKYLVLLIRLPVRFEVPVCSKITYYGKTVPHFLLERLNTENFESDRKTYCNVIPLEILTILRF